MIKQIIVAFLFIGLVSPLSAQSVRKVGPFDELVLSGKIDVYLEPAAEGEEESVHIDDTYDDDDAVNIVIRGRQLKISQLDGWTRRNNRRVRVLVKYGSLRSIRALAGAEVEGAETLVADYLDLKCGSGAKLRLDLRVQNLEGNASEGGDLRLSGQCKRQEVSANTGGIYDAAELTALETEVKANTGGRAVVVATERLDANASTGGEVRYSGNPTEKYTRSNLSGDIRGF